MTRCDVYDVFIYETLCNLVLTVSSIIIEGIEAVFFFFFTKRFHKHKKYKKRKSQKSGLSLICLLYAQKA